METVIQQPLHSSYVFLHIWFHSRSDFWFVAFQIHKTSDRSCTIIRFRIQNQAEYAKTYARILDRLGNERELLFFFLLTRGAAAQFQTEDDE